MPTPTVRNTRRCVAVTPRVVTRVAEAAATRGSRSLIRVAHQAAPARQPTASHQVALTPNGPMSNVPSNGPMNTPMRCDPPRRDSARARCVTGTASVRYFMRARRKTEEAIPMATTPAMRAMMFGTSARSAPLAANAEALTRARLSPNCSVKRAAGRLDSNEPNSSSMAMSAASATPAPRLAASTGMTGSSAPSAAPNNTEGP